MNCKRWRILAAEQKPVAWPPKTKAAWERHLARCRACAEAAAWDRVLSARLGQEPPLQAPPGFNRAVWARLAASEAGPQKAWRQWLPAAAGAMAVATAAVAVVLVTSRVLQHVPAPEVVIPQQAQAAPVRLRTAQTPVPNETEEPETEIASQPALQTVAAAPRLVQPLVAAAQETPVSTPAGPIARALALLSRPGKSALPVRPAPENRVLQAAGVSETGAAANQAQAQKGVQLFHNRLNLNHAEQARLEWTQPDSGHVTIKVFSREGKLVKRLLEAEVPAGAQTIEWDGRNEAGNSVASGIYLLVFQGNSGTQNFKIMVIK
jgi:hypothetical protein